MNKLDEEDAKGCALGAGAGAAMGGVGAGKPKSSATASEMAVWKSVHSPNELSSAPAAACECECECGWALDWGGADEPDGWRPKLARRAAEKAPSADGEVGWNGAVSPREVCEFARVAKAGWAPSMSPLSRLGGLNESVGERDIDRRLPKDSSEGAIETPLPNASN